MSEAIITALIMAGASIICQLLINRNNQKKRDEDDAAKEKKRAVEEALKEERLNTRLTNIEKNIEENNQKLDIHNGYAEKLGSIQTDIEVIKTSIEFLHHPNQKESKK